MRCSRPASSTPDQHAREETTTSQPEPALCTWDALRIFGCCVLLVLELGGQFVQIIPDEQDKLRWLRLASFASTIALSSFILCSGARGRALLNATTCTLLTMSLAVDLYRNLWPLLVVGGCPADQLAPVVWARIGLLTLNAAVLPLLQPRPGPLLPVQPDKVAKTSLLSQWTFADAWPLLLRAASSPSLRTANLPLLAPQDTSSYLMQRHQPASSPSPCSVRRHVFVGVLRAFWRDVVVLCALLVVELGAGFVRPWAVGRFLSALEDATTSAMKPSFFALVLFCGPLVVSLASSNYISISSRLGLRVKTLLTQSILDSALRTRASETDASQGKVHNLITSDLEAISEGRDFFVPLFYTPLELTLVILYLRALLGSSAYVGLAVMLLSAPLPVLVLRAMGKIEQHVLRAADGRMEDAREVVGGVKGLKVLDWEGVAAQRVLAHRETELGLVQRRNYIGCLNLVINSAVPGLAMGLTFTFHTIYFKRSLPPSVLFPTMAVFAMLQASLHTLFGEMSASVKGWVSLDRVDAFLRRSSELENPSCPSSSRSSPGKEAPAKGDRAADSCKTVYAWRPQPLSPSDFRLTLDLHLVPGKLNVITGPSGSGKSSVLLALMSEMHLVSEGADGRVELLEGKGIAYKPQQPWFFEGEIRQHILVDNSFDHARYGAAVRTCALDQDFASFEAGNRTLVVNHGANLSGGQRARLSLCRAIYSPAQTLLLDDVFSELDRHTACKIADGLCKSDLLMGRTVILAATDSRLVDSWAAQIVYLEAGHVVEVATGAGRSDGVGGRPSAGAPDKEDHPPCLPANVNAEDPALSPSTPPAPPCMQSSASIRRSTFRVLLHDFGRALAFLVLVLFSLASAAGMAVPWWLSNWSQEYENSPGDNVDAPYYLLVFVGISAAALCLFLATSLVTIAGFVKVSRLLHHRLLTSVLNAPVGWYDDTRPVGRILSMMSHDLKIVDGPLILTVGSMLENSATLACRTAAIAWLAPVFLLPAAVFAFVAVFVARTFVRAQLRLKRLLDRERFSLFSHLESTLRGTLFLRTNALQAWTSSQTQQRIDSLTRVALASVHVVRSITLSLEVLSAGVVALLALYIVHDGRLSSAAAGFILDSAITFSSLLIAQVLGINTLVVQANAVERLKEFFGENIPQEPVASTDGTPPSYWPTEGRLIVEKLSVRYKEGAAALRDVSFDLKPGEKVAVVGRTGSGKSTLVAGLLRLVESEGSVLLDGIDTRTINMSALRAAVTYVPQQPTFLSGTVRSNLDALAILDDDELADALQCMGAETIGSLLRLDDRVSVGGSNLSQGQQQLLALARAFLRRSPFLILDEATRSLPSCAVTHIHRTLRKRRTTVLSIVHSVEEARRCERVLRLDEGRVVGFGSPEEVLGEDSDAPPSAGRKTSFEG